MYEPCLVRVHTSSITVIASFERRESWLIGYQFFELDTSFVWILNGVIWSGSSLDIFIITFTKKKTKPMSSSFLYLHYVASKIHRDSTLLTIKRSGNVVKRCKLVIITFCMMLSRCSHNVACQRFTQPSREHLATNLESSLYIYFICQTRLVIQ